MPEPLVFDLEVTPERWTIQGPASPPRQIESPLANERFRGLVASLRDWAGRCLSAGPIPCGRQSSSKGRRAGCPLT